MKAATAKLLRAVIRLVEDDVREIADTVVEIDEREAIHEKANVGTFRLHDKRLEAVERIMREHLAMHVDGIEHSMRARCAEHSHATLGVRCVLDNGHTGEHLGPDESSWGA